MLHMSQGMKLSEQVPLHHDEEKQKLASIKKNFHNIVIFSENLLR